MSELKYPLLEVIEAIQQIRESKGPTRTEVCEFVRQNGKDQDNPLKRKPCGKGEGKTKRSSKPNKKQVLKTIRTLNKLVEDGVLTKKGKRYSFACKKQCDEDEDEGDDDENGDDQDEVDMDDDDCDEDQNEDNEEEEEEEEDDDDEEEEEEEDEDDDENEDECDDKDAEVTKDSGARDNLDKNGSSPIKSMSKDKFMLNSNNSNGNPSGKNNNDDGNDVKCAKSTDSSNGKKTGRVSSKGKRVIEKSGDGKGKGGEAIAFCVRDFIDSLNGPQGENNNQEKLTKSELMLQENMDAAERNDVKKIFQGKRRRSRGKRNFSSCDYRSRSPIKGGKNDKFNCLKRDLSNELCFRAVSSRFLNALMDGDMDVDPEDATGVDVDACRHRSPIGPPPPNTPGVHVNRTESCCSNQGIKKADVSKITEHSLKNVLPGPPAMLEGKDNGQRSWYPTEERDKEDGNLKGSLSSENDANFNDDDHPSLCSVCEKKKISS